MLLDRADQAISSTNMQKNAKLMLDNLADGKQDRYVLMRDNQPAAVILSIAGYEALMDELEDYRIEQVAISRLEQGDEAKFIPHAEMLVRFSDEK